MDEVFISYAWGGESEAIADALEQTFQEKGIKLVRDKTDLGYKGLIKEFMQQLGQGSVSWRSSVTNILNPKNCMYELLEISKNKDFSDRIFPIVLKNAGVYDAIERLNYIKYWEAKIDELEKGMKEVRSANLQGFREEIDLYTEIRNKMAELIDKLQNMNTLTSQSHQESSFEEIVRAIAKRIYGIIKQFKEITELPQSDKVQETTEYLDEIPPVDLFYGRDNELNELLKHVKKSRLITIRGMEGIGKTAVAVKLVEKVKELAEFEIIIWNDLRLISSFDDIVDNLIKLFRLSPGKNKIKQLINHFREHKCFLILDDVTAVIQLAKVEYDKCLDFIKNVAEIHHNSCLILTGNGFPEEINVYNNFNNYCYDIEIKGIGLKAAEELLQTQEYFLFPSSSTEEGEYIWQVFINYYGGNPKVLQIAASYIEDHYDGSIEKFLNERKEHVFLATSEAIEQLLDQQFKGLNEVAQRIMYCLAIENEPVTREQIENNLVLDKRNVIPGEIYRLLHFSWIEKRYDNVKSETVYTQVPMIMDHVTKKLISNVVEEIKTAEIKFLNYNSLIKAQAKDYIREVQIKRIFEPLKQELVQYFQDNKKFKEYLFKLLEEWQNKELIPGYFAGNIINLLRQLNADLSCRNFSNLVIWQADFQGIDLHETDFTNSDLHKSSFSETFSSILSVSFNSTGRYFATGEANGDVRLWLTDNLTQLDINSDTHKSQVWSVAFSPNQDMLASCSEDGTLSLWSINIESKNKLNCICKFEVPPKFLQCWRSIAFSPSGAVLTSAGDSTIYLAPYDLEWPSQFSQLANLIRDALCEKVLLLEHVGSTSVPGLSAKPIIDLILAVSNSADESSYVPPLEEKGFILRIREPDWFEHRVLKTPDIDGNLHVFSVGCEEIDRLLAFRNWLRVHEDDRRLYEQTKRELAARTWKDIQHYADAKLEVVQEILDRALGSIGRSLTDRSDTSEV